ncbi:MAG: hypothetical protein US48_C0017G0016 [Candidatus Levybacteria bacterium GW2011_GWA2_37_36]|nr:MAG: hypothetical protein US48_C0017G0016 [Candidatus Levybacteria bacterium GW2011_GWA2_37_36]
MRKVKVKKIGKKEKENELFFKCNCDCGQQLLVIDIGNGHCEINTRIDGRRKWTGVVLDKKKIKRLRDFLN